MKTAVSRKKHNEYKQSPCYTRCIDLISIHRQQTGSKLLAGTDDRMMGGNTWTKE